jgi:hypothetical protein
MCGASIMNSWHIYQSVGARSGADRVRQLDCRMVLRSHSAADDLSNRHDDICHSEKTMSHATFQQTSMFRLSTAPKMYLEHSRCGHIDTGAGTLLP